MYDKASDCITVNEARKDMFTLKGRSIDAISPSADAMLLHVKRVSRQASFPVRNPQSRRTGMVQRI